MKWGTPALCDFFDQLTGLIRTCLHSTRECYHKYRHKTISSDVIFNLPDFITVSGAEYPVRIDFLAA